MEDNKEQEERLCRRCGEKRERKSFDYKSKLSKLNDGEKYNIEFYRNMRDCNGGKIWLTIKRKRESLISIIIPQEKLYVLNEKNETNKNFYMRDIILPIKNYDITGDNVFMYF